MFEAVVFLDVDGVLNSGRWFSRREGDSGAVYWDEGYPESHFDPAAVELLNEITDRTGAVICVSSSWRVGRTLGEMTALLVGRGVKAAIVGMTPEGGAGRGTEIAHWLQHNRCAVFVILDDNSDMAPVRHRLVKTSFATGLEREHVELAIALLGERTKVLQAGDDSPVNACRGAAAMPISGPRTSGVMRGLKPLGDERARSAERSEDGNTAQDVTAGETALLTSSSGEPPTREAGVGASGVTAGCLSFPPVASPASRGPSPEPGDPEAAR